MSVTVRERPDSRSSCPFCREQVGDEDLRCGCGVTYHPECRAELSRCVTIGCAGKVPAPGRRAATTHRDVRCVRCQGLIRNDGDVCFGCWSPFHRRCLATGCCDRSARSDRVSDAPPDLSSVRIFLGVGAFVGFVVLFVTVEDWRLVRALGVLACGLYVALRVLGDRWRNRDV